MLKTVKELANEANVSVQTIYRHLNKLDKDKLIVKDSTGTQLLKDKAQEQILDALGLATTVAKDADDKEPVKEEKPASAQSDAIARDYIQTLKEQLKSKDLQLKEKDEQLKDMSKQLDSITVLLAQEKQEKQRLIEAKEEDEALTQDKRTLAQRLRDFFKR